MRVYMAMEASWFHPTWLFGLQECWLGRPSLWVCVCLETELLCVTFEIPRTRDTIWSLSSSVSISSLRRRISGPWSLPPLTCLHRVWCAVSFLSLSNPHRVCAFICPWVLWWPPNLGSCKQCCHECCTVSLFSSWSLSRYRSILWFPALVVRLFGRFSINRFVLHFVFCFYGQHGPRTDGTFPSRPCPGATVGPLFWEWLFWLVGVHPTSRMWFALLQ